jgi:hypothetical protein
MSLNNELKLKWAKKFQPLVGRKIKSVRWLTDKEVDSFGFNRSAIILFLDDGTSLVPSRDDEGNDAGALFLQIHEDSNKQMQTVPGTAPTI